MSDGRQTVGGLAVSRETIGKIESYSTLVQKWTKRINLISARSVAELWTRHIEDSAQLFRLAPLDFKLWADLGSGGGFPGIVIAILAKELAPHASVVLVESDIRKATFLNTVRRHLGLQVTVVVERIEETPPLMADVVSARALTDLPGLLDYASRHLAPGGVALFPRGAAEVIPNDVAREWRFRRTDYPSITDPNSRILKIEGLTRA